MTVLTGGTITDLVSYYTLPSSIIGNDKYDSLKAAFMYYTVATETPLQDLMQDILTLATKKYALPSSLQCLHCINHPQGHMGLELPCLPIFLSFSFSILSDNGAGHAEKNKSGWC